MFNEELGKKPYCICSSTQSGLESGGLKGYETENLILRGRE